MNQALLLALVWSLGTVGLAAPDPAEIIHPHPLAREAWPKSFLAEGELAARYPKKIKDFYKKGSSQTFWGHDRVPLSYIKFVHPNERGVVVIVPGRNEPYAVKYPELMYQFYQEGYSVWAMDLRSQGKSGRIAKNPREIHVWYFEDYVRDLGLFVNGMVRSQSHSRIFAFGHSLGGLVTALLAERQPGLFDGVVLSSPLLQILLPIPEWLAYTVYNTWGIWRQDSFSAYQADATPNPILSSEPKKALADDFAHDRMTHSYARYLLKLRGQAALPNGRSGGSSYRWVRETLNSTHEVMNGAAQAQTPMLIFKAGQDRLVEISSLDTFCRRAPWCELVTYPGSYHEIFQETDSIRTDAVLRVLRFFDNPSNAKPAGKVDELNYRLAQIDWHLGHGQTALARAALDRAQSYYAAKYLPTAGWDGAWKRRAEILDKREKTPAEKTLSEYLEWQDQHQGF